MKVSIIIPVYNAEKDIEQCIKNCQNQTLKDFEVIIVDDFSKDNTVKVISEQIKNDNRFKLISLNENRKQGYARNIGIEHAQGDFIMFFDADDDYSNQYVEKMYDKITRDDADFTACKFYLVDKNTNEIIENTDFSMFSEFPEEFYDGFHFSQIQPPVELFCKSNTVWDKIYRRSFLQKYDIKFPTDLFYKEDDIFSLRTTFRASKISVLNEYLYYYKIDKKKYDSANFQKEEIYDCFKAFEYMKKDLIEFGVFNEIAHDFMKFEIFTLKYFYKILKQEFHEDFFYKLKNSYSKYKNIPQEIKNTDNIMFNLLDKINDTEIFSPEIDEFLKNY